MFVYESNASLISAYVNLQGLCRVRRQVHPLWHATHPHLQHAEVCQDREEGGKKTIDEPNMQGLSNSPEVIRIYIFILFTSRQDLPERGPIKRDLIGFAYC